MPDLSLLIAGAFVIGCFYFLVRPPPVQDEELQAAENDEDELPDISHEGPSNFE